MLFLTTGTRNGGQSRYGRDRRSGQPPRLQSVGGGPGQGAAVVRAADIPANRQGARAHKHVQTEEDQPAERGL